MMQNSVRYSEMELDRPNFFGEFARVSDVCLDSIDEVGPRNRATAANIERGLVDGVI